MYVIFVDFRLLLILVLSRFKFEKISEDVVDDVVKLNKVEVFLVDVLVDVVIFGLFLVWSLLVVLLVIFKLDVVFDDVFFFFGLFLVCWKLWCILLLFVRGSWCVIDLLW